MNGDMDGQNQGAAILDGQVALVTGGGRGIGCVIAGHLAAAGAAVAVLSRSANELADTVARIATTGGRATAVPADVTDRAAVDAAVAEVERRLGPVDLLVNNAARARGLGEMWQVDPEDWWRDVEVNLRGPFLCARAVLPGMLARGHGRIINVTSGIGGVPGPALSGYVISKAALMRLTDSLAAEVAGSGIAIFAISPGVVRTPMTDYLLTSPVTTRWYPWFPKVFEEGREEPPETIAQWIVALSSGRADVLSGRFLSTRADNLDDMIARAEEIGRDDLHVLRLRT
jgi:NAD(P)-dependent dehydrogenase (short-subunit alcohol dehydrogenase family)